MARYKSFAYSQKKYGTSTVTEGGPLTWVFLVDWDRNGVYEGENEAQWLVGYSLRRGCENYIDPDGQGFEHMQPCSLSLSLADPNRRFDPRNTASPLYPNVNRGVKCQIAVYDNSVSPRVRYTRFTGYIDNIIPNTRRREVKITCKGNLQTLSDYDLTFEAAHLSTTVSKSFVTLLQDSEYPGGKLIDTDNQPIRSFSVNKQKAGRVAGELADAALGQFFIDVEGRARFYSRSHNYGAAVTIDESIVLKDFQIPQPWDSVFNKVDVICNKQVQEHPSVIFYLNDPLLLDTGAAVSIYPSFGSCTDISVGAAEAYSNADGTGTNIIANVTVSNFQVGPMGGVISFTTTAAGYLTKFELRGRKWKDVEEIFNHSATSIYGNRKFTLQSPYLQDRNYANAFMAILWPFLDDDRESLIIQLETRYSVQFAYDLLTKINFTSATYDIDDDYWIMGIDEQWLSPNGQAVRTTFYLSKIITDSTSITPALDEAMPELPAPLGLDNPAGDEDTQDAVNGTGIPGANIKALYLTAYETGIAPGTPVWTLRTVTFDTELFDPENLFTAPGTSITISTAGRYVIFLNGYGMAEFPAATADGGSLGMYCSFIAYKNGAQITQNYPMSAYSRAIKSSLGDWQARGFMSNSIVCDFIAGDVLTVKLNFAVYFTGTENNRSYRCGLLMYKISEST